MEPYPARANHWLNTEAGETQSDLSERKSSEDLGWGWPDRKTPDTTKADVTEVDE